MKTSTIIIGAIVLAVGGYIIYRLWSSSQQASTISNLSTAVNTLSQQVSTVQQQQDIAAQQKNRNLAASKIPG